MKSTEYIKYLKKESRKKIIIFLCQLFLLITLLFLWQYASDKKIINTFITSSPKNIINTLIELHHQNNLWHHIWITTYETIISFLLGTSLGIIIAILFWYHPFIAKVIDPYLTVFNSLPKVSLGPILIIWIGANTKSIITMALLISLIITIINIYNGFTKTDITKIKLLQTFHATKIQLLTYLILPDNYKTIISSLKINISMSFIGLLPPVGEKIFFNKCYSRY